MPNFGFGLKATSIFVTLLSLDGFKCDPETKFQSLHKVSSEAEQRFYRKPPVAALFSLIK